MLTPDVMIHVQDSLSQDQRQTIEDALRSVDGVIAPRFGKTNLLVVLYNKERTNAAALLRAVTSAGYRARLVGL